MQSILQVFTLRLVTDGNDRDKNARERSLRHLLVNVRCYIRKLTFSERNLENVVHATNITLLHAGILCRQIIASFTRYCAFRRVMLRCHSCGK